MNKNIFFKITIIFIVVFTGCEKTTADEEKNPYSKFEVDKTYASKGESIQFTDQSMNTPTSWEWNFGDGNFSTEQNPSHSYAYTGTFTVSLTVENGAGVNTKTEEEFITIAHANITGQTGNVSDIDGNNYEWIGIGGQAWMTENLKTTKYADGTNIPTVVDNDDSGDSSDEWAALENNNSAKAYCWYNDDSGNKDLYGAYYTHAAATNGNSSGNFVQGVCPDGWHIPNDAEWKELVIFVSYDGHEGNEGSALKATNGWNNDGNGTDIYGFSALPGGYRYHGLPCEYNRAGEQGRWWSSTEGNSNEVGHNITMVYNWTNVELGDYFKSAGYSVRCVRDTI
jgi:uncharacterized protein (TIGR02145 family)